MYNFTRTLKPIRDARSVSLLMPSRMASSQHSEVAPLQRFMGNQTSQRLFSINGPSLASLAGVDAAIQPKLTVNKPGDQYEQEADRVADQVMRNSEGKVQTQSEGVQAKGGRGGTLDGNSESRISGSRASGSPLAPAAQSFFESRMNHDFSGVRVHTDGHAAQMNQQLGAQAFTHQRDIYFAAGQYNPQSISGQRLLAHELTHVVQQRSRSRRIGAQGPGLSQAPVHVQRKLAMTGSAAHLARVLVVMNAGIDIRYQARFDSANQVEIVSSGNQGPPSPQQQYFTTRLRSLINEAGTTTVSVNSGSRTIVGSYAGSDIDIADIEALGIGLPGWDARAALLHELVEQREKQLGTTAAQRAYGSATTGAHGQGLAAELGMIGAVLESDSGLVGASANANGTMNGTRTVVFRYPTGTRYRVVVTLTSNNITNVVRTKLP